MPGLGDTLDYLSSSLDKPGRAVRGVLAGKPREAMAALPFSDTLGLTDPNDRVSGRNLTDQYGLTRKDDKGWGSWGAGHAAEMALDPLAWLPASHAFKAIQKAGKFDGIGSALGKFGADEAGTLRMDFLNAAKDQSTPLGRLHGLADAAGVKVYPNAARPTESALNLPYHLDDVLGSDQAFEQNMRRQFGYSTMKPHAVWNGGLGQIIPNVQSHPDLWFDMDKMAQHANNVYGGNKKLKIPKLWSSTPSTEHISVHEIGHGLHNQKIGDAFNDWDEIQRWGNHPRPAGPGLSKALSGYSDANPAEFVAESYAKMAHELASGTTNHMAESLSPKLWDLYYRTLHGPGISMPLLDKLRSYRG